MNRTRVGIIGGGFTGLTAAYRLMKQGIGVTIFEASDRLGGLAAGSSLAGHNVERAYHFLYRTDEYILALVEELGLGDALTYHKSSIATYFGDTLYPMERPLDLIRFNPISLTSRIRAGLSVLWLQRLKDWRKLSEVTALEWLRRYAGREVTEVIWEPLLRGKFDRYYDKVTMSWLWGRVVQRVDSRDPGLGGEVLGYFDGGFRIVVDALEEPLRSAGADIRLGSPVSRLSYDPESDQVLVAGAAGTERFDRVLATVPSHVLGRMISEYESVDPAYFQKLNSIDYLDAVVLVFASKQKFTDYYWHNINSPDAPFVVFLSLTNLVGSKRFDGLNIYYIGDYVPPGHAYTSMDADALKARWYGELKRIFPAFDPAAVIEDELSRLRNAQHIVDIGFEDKKLVPHETPCPGVLMCNFSQIYPMDRGTNYAVRDGNTMADRLIKSLAARCPPDAGASTRATGAHRPRAQEAAAAKAPSWREGEPA